MNTVLTVFLAMSLIVTGDTAGKLLTADGCSPWFVAWSRFLLAGLILFPLVRPTFADLKNITNGKVVLRAIFIVGAITGMLTALKTEPIANVFGAFFISPVVTYFFAALFLKEKITLNRSLFLLLGLLGVMLVVKPGFGATVGIVFALLAGVLHGSYMVTTRWLAGSYGSQFLLFSQLLIGSILLAPAGLNNFIPDLNWHAGMLIFISSAASAAGNYLIVLASRSAQASLIAPLVYSQLIAAAVSGYLVFSSLPDLVALLGLGLILLSGLGSFAVVRREGVNKNKPEVPAVAAASNS